MSHRETSQMFREDERRRSAESVEHHRHETKRHAHRASNIAQANTQRREELRAFLNKHKTFNDAGLGRRVTYLIPVAAIPAALALDYTLFGGTAKYLAGIMFPDAPQMVWVVRFIVSVAVLTLEMFVAYMIVLARQRRETDGAAQPARWLWTTLGVVLVAAIAAFTVVAHPAMVDDAGVTLSADRNMRLLGLLVIVAFSLVVHSSIILGGHWIEEGIAFSGFLRGHRNRVRRINHGDDEEEREGQLTARSFDSFYEERERHNGSYPEHPIPVGEFDVVTARIINTLSGYERIRVANDPRRESRNGENGAASSPSSTLRPEPVPSTARSTSTRETVASSPVNTNGNGASPSDADDDLRGVVEYQNMLLDRRRRNNDGELRGEE